MRAAVTVRRAALDAVASLRQTALEKDDMTREPGVFERAAGPPKEPAFDLYSKRCDPL